MKRQNKIEKAAQSIAYSYKDALLKPTIDYVRLFCDVQQIKTTAKQRQAILDRALEIRYNDDYAPIQKIHGIGHGGSFSKR